MCDKSEHAHIFTVSGRVRRVDECLRALVQHLNDIGIETFDSCCGHGETRGHVTIDRKDADRALSLGFRVCVDAGVVVPAYPFTSLEDHANIILPHTIATDEASQAVSEGRAVVAHG